MTWHKMDAPPPGTIEAVQRTFDDGLDVVIAIRQSGDSFEVFSFAECRTSGPCDALVGQAASLVGARELVGGERAAWEQYASDPAPSLRNLRVVRTGAAEQADAAGDHRAGNENRNARS